MDATKIEKARRPVLYLVLAFSFLSFLLVPARVVSLRRRFERQQPARWAGVTNNGPFRYVLPYEDLGFSDEGSYAARARQVYLHGRPYGPWLGGRSLKSWVFDCLMFYPIGFFIWLCGGNFTFGWLVARAAVGCGWFFMLFSLFRAYSRDESYALMIATFVFFFLDTLRESVMLAFQLFVHPAAVVHGLGYVSTTLFLPISFFLRLPVEGEGFLWVAGMMAGAIAVALSPRRRPLAAAAVGAACGLLCFFHFFHWVACVLALFFLATANWRDRGISESGSFNLNAAAGVAALVSGAYFLFARSLTKDYMLDMIDRSGGWGRHFHPESLAFLLFAALCWSLARRRQDLRRQILASAAALELAAFVLANLSLALGYDLMFSEHAAHFAAFAALLSFSCWMLERESLKKRLKKHALVLTIFFCAWFAFKAKAWSDLHFKLYGIPRDVAAASQWMNANVPKGSLLLSLSAPINLLLPLESNMRWPVTFSGSVNGEPVRTEDNMRGFARMLKTVDAEPEKFLEARWLHSSEVWAARGVEENLTGDMDWEGVERSWWPVFLIEMTGTERERETAWNRISGYIQEEKPMSESFYLWVQKGDEEFLRRTPDELGGRLIFRNPSVSLYAFPSGVSSKSS